jgi:hypothetical protein
MARIMSFVTVVFILVPVAQLWVNSFLIITIGMDFLYSGVHQLFWFLGGLETTTKDFIC